MELNDLVIELETKYGMKVLDPEMVDKLVKDADLGRKLLEVDYVRQQTNQRTAMASWIVFLPIYLFTVVFLITLGIILI